MNGREKRTQRILERILDAALKLFSTDGIEKVSMDEVAAEAGVSKVTIYKYFHSKEALRKAVVNRYTDQVIAATEALVTSDLDFTEKLRLTLKVKTSKMALESTREFANLLQKDREAEGRLNRRIKEIIFRFFEQGKQQGYIDQDLPFEILYLHSEIYQAGYTAKLSEIEAQISDPKDLEQLNDLYFWGILKNR